MKKTLKLIVALLLLVSIIIQPVSVLAIGISNEEFTNSESSNNMLNEEEQEDETKEEPEENNEVSKNLEETENEEKTLTEEQQEEIGGENTEKAILEDVKEQSEAQQGPEQTSAPEGNNTEKYQSENPLEKQEKTQDEPQKTEDDLCDFVVEIILRLPTEDNFEIKLNKENQEYLAQKNAQEDKIYYNFENIEKGNYVVTITGKNYITYTQNVELSAGVTKISLSNGHDINDLLSKNQTQYGVISLGDVTENGVIDDEDENKMIEAIESKVYNAKFDLNGDGKIDIVDLSYVTFNKGNNIQSTPLKMLKLNEQNIESLTGTEITSTGKDVSSIFKDDGEHVELKPKNGQDISKANPVEITLNVEDSKDKTEAIVIEPPKDKSNIIKNGEMEVTYFNDLGVEETITVNISSTLDIAEANLEAIPLKVASLNGTPTPRKVMEAKVQKDGTIIIDLGGQIAIKKITIRITETGSNKLADIAKVEFLNNMESKIPEPEMDIPENVTAIPGSEQFTVNWKKAVNITGYEVAVTSQGITEVVYSAANSITINKFNGKDIKNGTTFKVKVQSVNGDWKSGYSGEVEVTPEANKEPDAPENVRITPGYKFLKISWKAMDDTDTYNLYYKQDGETEYQVVKGITTNSYMLTELADGVKYQIYLTGTNKIGTSKPSQIYESKTVAAEPPITSNYKLLNTPNGVNEITSHVKDVTYPGGNAPQDKFDIVDNDYTSSWKASPTWDVGGFNDYKKAPIVEFDDFYEMDRIILVPDQAQQYDYFYHTIYYWNENGQKVKLWNQMQMQAKTSKNGKKYYEYEFSAPIKTNKIQINLALYSANNSASISISEMKFYHYDTIQTEINNLFTDQMHLVLREDVTAETIKNLEDRLNTPDSYSGELHYKKDLLQRELDTAKLILNDEKIKSVIQIDTSVSKKYDGHLSMVGGLNASQPLGVVGYANETIAIYVGSPNKATGTATNLRLVATQYHAESGSWQRSVQNLKIGKNEITIPNIQDLATEHGGSLYIEYVGNNKNEQYAVRVSGGHDIPMLNISKVADENERKALVKAYVEELESYVPTIESLHNEKHKGSETLVDYDFDQTNCILGATEIVIDKMMYSVSAKQILSALKGTTDEKAEQLYNSLIAMEKMIDLFYQHKGLNDAGGAYNKLPTSRLNIRYQRMFAGAFMYAGGSHIGIEWGSVPGLATSVPVTSDENGKYISGRYFGWGIAHEIGHIINEGSYAVAEVTNNYFSVLAQAKDTNDSVRFKYDNVYSKVTSGAKGKASNVFTQLAMYWQLHLAYDKGGYNYKTFDNYTEQLENLFFARVDTYSRNVANAPKPGGIALTIKGADKDNVLMRLSVAAAEKNILEFFEDWGMVPDEGTIAYANQFEKETRRIKFVNDEARAYELAGGKGFAEGTLVTANIANTNTDSIVNDTQITINVALQNGDTNALLGYEIYRNGKSVGFITADKTEFVDTINVNNRVYTYEVVAIDKLLNATERFKLDPIKVRHDGSIAKDGFTITTNMVSEEDTKEEEDQSCAGMPSVQAVSKLIDKDVSNVYTGKTTEDAEIVLELNEVLSIIGVKVIKASSEENLSEYEIQIMNENQEWQTVKTGTFSFDGNVSTIYFDKFEENKDARVEVYNTAYVKLILKNSTGVEMNVSISELDVLGKPGDNVEILKENGIGTLKADYILDEETGEKIPSGSFVVTGEYSGHPAYNAIKLYDENGNIIEGMQVIFATEPVDGNLGNITEGTWIYYIEPEDLANLDKLPTKVKAELYRVDDALTLEGERLVSDSLERNVPETLPEIEINKGN